MLSFLKKIFDRLFTSSTHTIYKEDNHRYEEGRIIKEFLTNVYLNLYKNCSVENKEQQFELLKNSYKDIINFSTIEFLSWGAQKYEWIFNDEVLIHNSDPYEARFKTDFEKILIELLSINDIK